ncbi:hypothetical protein Asppvi_003466 [Aspergillus pseudoviridinutans]|uniref:Uncharacterized protein n=1 Tax=Aspergillus pseudoviridinutans TaxID=1517512 RepID=A0A9P3B4W8_9EURO|nr:uncharacterized protein Asppvi_003466 [Aspergillus pseudoviridinutans]GIJ84617.1 hypothetical protein Asppvi_003466 [Aspergillus pseudoviridinutans]
MSTSNATRAILGLFALLWILLLITAAGIQQNSWFLVAVGGVGILQNITFAGIPRHPRAHGVHIEFVEVIAQEKVMQTLYKVEDVYPRLGQMKRENGRSTGNGVLDSKGRKLEHSNGTNTSTRIYLLSEITAPDGQHDFPDNSASGAQVDDNSYQAEINPAAYGINATAPSFEESFSNIYDSCSSDDKENVQENADRTAPLPCNDQEGAVNVSDKESNHPAKRHRGNGRESKSSNTTPLQVHPAPDQATELQPPNPAAEGTRLVSMRTMCPSTGNILAQPAVKRILPAPL